MGNDVPFLWFLDPGFIIFAAVVVVGYLIYQWIYP